LGGTGGRVKGPAHGIRVGRFAEPAPVISPCFRRFSQWVKNVVLRRLLEALMLDLQARREIDLLECFIEGAFVVAKKRGV